MILDADEIVLLTCCCYIMYMMNSGDDMNTRVELSSVGVSKSEDKMNTGIVTSNVGINKSEDRMNIGVDVSSVGVSKSEDKVNIKIEDKVNIGIESNNTELNSNKNERGGCWEHNFSVEFPIIYGNVKNGVVSVDVDSPHAGYMIRGKLLNGVLNGKCELLNRNCKVIGSFNFVDGIVNGSRIRISVANKERAPFDDLFLSEDINKTEDSEWFGITDRNDIYIKCYLDTENLSNYKGKSLLKVLIAYFDRIRGYRFEPDSNLKESFRIEGNIIYVPRKFFTKKKRSLDP